MRSWEPPWLRMTNDDDDDDDDDDGDGGSPWEEQGPAL